MRHFTIEEASVALARVRPIAEAMIAAFRELHALRAQLIDIDQRHRGNGDTRDAQRAEELRTAAERASAGLEAAVEALEKMGVQVKDLERGLVDFPTLHPATGETVLLCWRVGEEAIGYWHGFDEGYAGRKPLPF